MKKHYGGIGYNECDGSPDELRDGIPHRAFMDWEGE
jgi:hypothetical protein